MIIARYCSADHDFIQREIKITISVKLLILLASLACRYIPPMSEQEMTGSLALFVMIPLLNVVHIFMPAICSLKKRMALSRLLTEGGERRFQLMLQDPDFWDSFAQTLADDFCVGMSEMI